MKILIKIASLFLLILCTPSIKPSLRNWAVACWARHQISNYSDVLDNIKKLHEMGLEIPESALYSVVCEAINCDAISERQQIIRDVINFFQQNGLDMARLLGIKHSPHCMAPRQNAITLAGCELDSTTFEMLLNVENLNPKYFSCILHHIALRGWIPGNVNALVSRGADINTEVEYFNGVKYTALDVVATLRPAERSKNMEEAFFKLGGKKYDQLRAVQASAATAE